MFTQNLLTAVNVEKTEQKEAPQAVYAAPRMFAVGETAALIQGFASYGWYDAKYGYHHN